MNEKNQPDFEMDIRSFRKIQVLGHGSFSVVKLMKDIYSKQFTVKYFSRGISCRDKKEAQIFSRELETFCHLVHPCIIRVYRFSRDVKGCEGALVMEYMSNGSLDHVLECVRQGNPPDFWNDTGIAIIVCGILVGMDFVHSRGMVHRDLKPANILIDGAGRIRIGDFGSAKFIEDPIYLSGNYQETAQYQTPELSGEDPYTTKVDVFSFALVLYEILVRRPVYLAKLSAVQIMRKVCSKVRADLPSDMNDGVKTLIIQCWSGDPDDRLSFSEILAELHKIRFKILPNVNSNAVNQYLFDVRRQQDELTST
jgi:NIMA (never in mitosis gene a)-related kinase